MEASSGLVPCLCLKSTENLSGRVRPGEAPVEKRDLILNLNNPIGREGWSVGPDWGGVATRAGGGDGVRV